MDSPNRTENRNSGSQASITWTCWKPKRSASHLPIPGPPCWKTRTSSPYAAPTDSRFRTMAVSGTTTERNTIISRRNDSARTNASTIGWYRSVMAKKSRLRAGSPPTNTWAADPGGNAAGTYCDLIRPTDPTAAFPEGSPITGAETRTVSPAGPTSTVEGPNPPSRRSRPRRSSIPRCTGGAVARPSITICTGFVTPPENCDASTVNARFDSTLSGTVLTPEKPVSSRTNEEAASTRNPAAATMLTTGRRMTVPATRPQKPAAGSTATFLLRRRRRRRSTRSPRRWRTAGSRVSAPVTAAVERFGGLDIAFLNAGVATGCGVGDDFDLERYRRAKAVNVDGVVFGMHAALPALRARGGGDIVVTASLAGLTAVPFDPIYGANKHAVVGLVRAVGPMFAGDGIRINAVCPGFADTPILGAWREHLAASEVPLLQADDVAD